MARRKRTAFVPRKVFAVSFGSVIPACVAFGIEACSTGPVIGVAAVAYCCFEASTHDGDASDAPATDSPNDTASEAASDSAGDAPKD